MHKLEELCNNVFTFDTKGSQLTLKECLKATIIVHGHYYYLQQIVESPESAHEIYYIPKYNRLFTYEQVKTFINKKSKEQFVLFSDSEATITHVFGYITRSENQLIVKLLSAWENTGKLSLIGELKTKVKNPEWLEEQWKPEGSPIAKLEPHPYGGPSSLTIYFKEDACKQYYKSTNSIEIINSDAEERASYGTKELLQRFLRIDGLTRITASWDYRSYKFEIGVKPEIETASLARRYGMELPHETDRRWSLRHGDNYMIDSYSTLDLSVPRQDIKRITERLSAILEEKDKDRVDFFSTFVEQKLLLITPPMKGCRRPTYHLFCGFRCNHITEIVELARGELLMKDMTPETCYVLCHDGDYHETSYNVKTFFRDMIHEADIDIESFEHWSEEKSQHPQLLKTLSQGYFDTINLDTIKIFNKLPFGANFIEQLVKTKHGYLGVDIAKYINSHADNLQFVCNSLSDVFPGINAEATSLYGTFGLSKPTAEFLLTDTNTYDTLKEKYNIIRQNAVNGVLTKEGMKNIEVYMSLYKQGKTKYTCATGRTFNLAKYPTIYKSIYKMNNRINAMCGENNYRRNDLLRRYSEIVEAYVSFVDYKEFSAVPEEKENWTPENNAIFLEFSLGGSPENPLDPIEEMRTREQHATRSLDVYKAKLNEKLRGQNEISYAFRKQHALSRLVSTKTLEAEKGDFAGYTVIAPSQIYGAHTPGSIEKEGYDMNHCVFRSYANNIALGNYTVLYLRRAKDPDTSLVTIGISAEGRINQTFGINDSQISTAQAKAIVAWAKTKEGLLTFTSEGVTCRPSGWNPAVVIPELPKPDANWKQKLAAITE